MKPVHHTSTNPEAALQMLLGEMNKQKRLLATLAAGVRALTHEERMLMKDFPDELVLTLLTVENEY